MLRRNFVQGMLATAAVVVAPSLGAESPTAPRSARGALVRAGKDRHDKPMRLLGRIPADTKVATADSGGETYIFQHRNMSAGGPPRHIHFAQDEWFYAIAGDFVFEIGEERFELGPGDMIFAPRQVPHVWAHIGQEPGTILIGLAPAGTAEAFFSKVASYASPPPPDELAAVFAEHAMQVLGPPLPV